MSQRIIQLTLPHVGNMAVPIQLQSSPFLRQRASVHMNEEIIKSDEFITCLHWMKCIITSRRAVGISAPQLGFGFRAIAWRHPAGHARYILNPSFIRIGDEIFKSKEGCLSSPGQRHTMSRPKKILLSGQNLDLTNVEFKVTELEAAIVQHEIDHLNGIPWPPE